MHREIPIVNFYFKKLVHFFSAYLFMQKIYTVFCDIRNFETVYSFPMM